MATMSQSLRDRLFHAFGDTHRDEFEDLLDSSAPTAISAGLRAKLHSWLCNDAYAEELAGILAGNLATCSDRLEELLRSALADSECGDDLVTLLNAILGSPNSPSATVSSTPSSTPSRTPSATPSATVSSTPSSTPSPSATESNTPSSTPSPSSTESNTPSSTPSSTESSSPSSTASSTPSATGT